MMRGRTVVTLTITRLTALVAVLLFIGPLTAKPQQSGKVWHIANMSVGDKAAHHVAFETAMKQLGYVEGQNLVIERRFLGGRLDATDEVMRDVVRRNVDLIVAWAAPMAAAAKRATSTIPVVFLAVRAPVERGLVPSLARPGANLTGISTFAVETIDPKLFELAKELAPQLSRVAVLRSSVDPPRAIERQERAARALGITLAPIPFSTLTDVGSAGDVLERSKAQVLIAPDTPLLYMRRKEIIQFAAKQRLPVVYPFREAVEDGGLIALSTDFQEMARRGAIYVDKIFRGAKAADLPVEQPTRLQLVINMKTARALGVTIPPSLLLRADQIVE